MSRVGALALLSQYGTLDWLALAKGMGEPRPHRRNG
jgi:hypothetical protein